VVVFHFRAQHVPAASPIIMTPSSATACASCPARWPLAAARARVRVRVSARARARAASPRVRVPRAHLPPRRRGVALVARDATRGDAASSDADASKVSNASSAFSDERTPERGTSSRPPPPKTPPKTPPPEPAPDLDAIARRLDRLRERSREMLREADALEARAAAAGVIEKRDETSESSPPSTSPRAAPDAASDDARQTSAGVSNRTGSVASNAVARVGTPSRSSRSRAVAAAAAAAAAASVAAAALAASSSFAAVLGAEPAVAVLGGAAVYGAVKLAETIDAKRRNPTRVDTFDLSTATGAFEKTDAAAAARNAAAKMAVDATLREKLYEEYLRATPTAANKPAQGGGELLSAPEAKMEAEAEAGAKSSEAKAQSSEAKAEAKSSTPSPSSPPPLSSSSDDERTSDFRESLSRALRTVSGHERWFASASGTAAARAAFVALDDVAVRRAAAVAKTYALSAPLPPKPGKESRDAYRRAIEGGREGGLFFPRGGGMAIDGGATGGDAAAAPGEAAPGSSKKGDEGEPVGDSSSGSGSGSGTSGSGSDAIARRREAALRDEAFLERARREMYEAHQRRAAVFSSSLSPSSRARAEPPRSAREAARAQEARIAAKRRDAAVVDAASTGSASRSDSDSGDASRRSGGSSSFGGRLLSAPAAAARFLVGVILGVLERFRAAWGRLWWAGGR